MKSLSSIVCPFRGSRTRRIAAGVLLLGCGLVAPAGAQAPRPERTRLYTRPDTSLPGGIRGQVAAPSEPLEEVLALPYERPEHVYQAEILDPERRTFEFRGLPMDRYGLLLIYADRFFEGVRLSRQDSTLTNDDREAIASIIDRSEPFFTEKRLHRVAGETGRGGEARAICTFLRDREAESYMGESRTGFRRTFKLIQLRQVGPGWQVVRARDLYPVWSDVQGLRPRHHYHPRLADIRVTDRITDLGTLDLMTETDR